MGTIYFNGESYGGGGGSSDALIYNPNTDYFGMVYDGTWRDVLYAGFQEESLVPILTSNVSSDVGEAIRDSASNDQGVAYYDRQFPLEAFKAFDGDNNTCWSSNSVGPSNAYVGFHWFSPVIVARVELTLMKILSDRTTIPSAWTIYTSNDGQVWREAGSVTTKVDEVVSLQLPTARQCSYVKLMSSASNIGWGDYVAISEIKIYGRKVSN
jgi:hypothetical protein